MRRAVPVVVRALNNVSCLPTRELLARLRLPYKIEVN